MFSATPQSLMEVTGALSNCARSAGFNFGADTALVTVQHMLYQTVDLFRAVGNVGLPPENIFALGKVYSNSASVITTIRNMGATVVESTFPTPGEFDDAFDRDTRRLWNTVTENLAQRRIKRIIVLDDGGRCVVNIPLDLLSRYSIAGVEQTSLGMFLFEESPPAIPVFTWARSAVKLQIGGHIFSQCLIDKIEAEFLRGRSLRGAEVGIIGLGSIGKAAADIVAKQGNTVSFYDPAGALELPPYLAGKITRVDSLEELMLRCEYVFGASGRNPFKDRWPMAHRPGIKLVSGSGGDQEFGPIVRYLRERPDFKVAPDTWEITSPNGPSGPIRIAYLGFPYNFVSRAEAAVPTHIVQLETAGLLAGLIQARSYLGLVEAGYERDTGIHRIAPDAQRFIYNKWLTAMKNRGVDIRKLYGYDPSLIAATERPDWLADNTQPRLQADSKSEKRVEEVMRSILRGCGQPAC
jgi:D-isomer specific 2-hydroxyacid dehydrogenase, NAD binding domain